MQVFVITMRDDGSDRVMGVYKNRDRAEFWVNRFKKMMNGSGVDRTFTISSSWFE